MYTKRINQFRSTAHMPQPGQPGTNDSTITRTCKPTHSQAVRCDSAGHTAARWVAAPARKRALLNRIMLATASTAAGEPELVQCCWQVPLQSQPRSNALPPQQHEAIAK